MDRPIDEQEVNELCKEYLAIEIAKEQLAITLKDVKDKIVALSDGKDSLYTGEYAIEVKRSEAWSWDQSLLEALALVIPEVKVSRTVDKAVFAGLSSAVQSQLTPALETKLGRTTIKVKNLADHD